jgi:hypothetical protein
LDIDGIRLSKTTQIKATVDVASARINTIFCRV